MRLPPERIGLMPAAGHARRLGAIQCSKELLPVLAGEDQEPVCANLLRQFHQAEVDNVCIVLRRAKSDIPKTLERGQKYAVELNYIKVEESPSVPHSIDAAYSAINQREVVFGFPDILIAPADALRTLAAERAKSQADVMLGLFPSSQPEKVDMVEYDKQHNLRAIIIKDPTCKLRETWLNAVWNARFTDFLHAWIVQKETSNNNSELHLGAVFSAAMTRGLKVRVHRFFDGSYLDIGTPDDLSRAQEIRWPS